MDWLAFLSLILSIGSIVSLSSLRFAISDFLEASNLEYVDFLLIRVCDLSISISAFSTLISFYLTTAGCNQLSVIFSIILQFVAFFVLYFGLLLSKGTKSYVLEYEHKLFVMNNQRKLRILDTVDCYSNRFTLCNRSKSSVSKSVSCFTQIHKKSQKIIRQFGHTLTFQSIVWYFISFLITKVSKKSRSENEMGLFLKGNYLNHEFVFR